MNALVVEDLVIEDFIGEECVVEDLGTIAEDCHLDLRTGCGHCKNTNTNERRVEFIVRHISFVQFLSYFELYTNNVEAIRSHRLE